MSVQWNYLYLERACSPLLRVSYDSDSSFFGTMN